MKNVGKVLTAISVCYLIIAGTSYFVQDAVISAILFLSIPVALYLAMMAYEVITGKIFAPGAKQRRKRILPTFFGKNSIFKNLDEQQLINIR